MERKYNGIIPDPRTEEEKSLTYQHDELFSGLPNPIWEEREAKKYPLRWQDGSSACLAFTIAKVLGIDEVYEGREYVELSARDIYLRRANKPSGGMWFTNALDIARNYGATLESLVPSDGKGESLMNDHANVSAETSKVGLKYKTAGYVQLPLDIDKIASVTSLGKGIVFGFRFDREEWTKIPWVKPNSTLEVGHGVAGVDNVLRKGIKTIVIEDSWDTSFTPPAWQRDITNEFLKARCIFAGYTMNFIYEEEVSNKPKHTFKFSMKYGDRNKDVVALQDILKYEGLFPLNVESTGNFLGTTKRGVIKLQEKYTNEILKPWGLTKGTGFVGASTLKFLNKKYA